MEYIRGVHKPFSSMLVKKEKENTKKCLNGISRNEVKHIYYSTYD